MVTNTRSLVNAAWAAAILGTFFEPVYALSRFATELGTRDLEVPTIGVWARPMADLLAPLIGWSDPQSVYLTLGKAWVFLLAPLVLVAVGRYRQREPIGAERWLWRVAITGYCLVLASSVGDFWTPWTNASFYALTIPGFLVSLAGSTVLGVVLVRRGFAPRLAAWMLALSLPAFVACTFTLAFGGGLLFLIWTWAFAARGLQASSVRATGMLSAADGT